MEMSRITDRNACAYKEIYEILKIFPQELVSQIPQEIIDFFHNNMDTNYEYDISVDTFDGKTMLEETKAILTILFRDYWSTPTQKEKILSYEKIAKNRIEEENRIKYNADNLFKNRNLQKKNEKQIEETAIIEYKESIFKKIINRILNIFKFR